MSLYNNCLGIASLLLVMSIEHLLGRENWSQIQWRREPGFLRRLNTSGSADTIGSGIRNPGRLEAASFKLDSD